MGLGKINVTIVRNLGQSSYLQVIVVVRLLYWQKAVGKINTGIRYTGSG